MTNEKYPVPIMRSTDVEKVTIELESSKSVAKDINFIYNEKSGDILVRPSPLKKAAIGKIDHTRIDLQQAIDCIAYGEIGHNGFTLGRVQKIDQVIRIGIRTSGLGVIAGVAAASGIVGASPSVGLSLGGAVAVAGAAIIVTAKMAKTYTENKHAELSVGIATRNSSTESLVKATVGFGSEGFGKSLKF